MQADNYNTIPLTTSNNHNFFKSFKAQGNHIGRIARLAATLSIAFALLVPPLAASKSVNLNADVLGVTGAPAQSMFFAATGKAVAGDFLATFQRYGLERIGYPLSEERVENGQTVQYFERVRMERHPELASKGYGVLLSRLGWDLSNGSKFPKVAPFASTKGKAYIAETGHSLPEPFLSYWKNNGGVAFFGYPIAEPMNDGGLYVQWFERARMEYHPELVKSGKTVELSLLGSQVLSQGAPSLPASTQKQQQPAAQPQAPQVTLSANESYLLRAVNDQRVAAGLGQVTIDASITDLARSRSNDMAQRNYFSHTTPENTNFLGMLGDRKIGYKFAGEILARNNYPSDQAAQTAIDSYLSSPAHKAIIFDGRYTSVGVGYTFSEEDSMHYFTMIFVQK